METAHNKNLKGCVNMVDPLVVVHGAKYVLVHKYMLQNLVRSCKHRRKGENNRGKNNNVYRARMWLLLVLLATENRHLQYIDSHRGERRTYIDISWFKKPESKSDLGFEEYDAISWYYTNKFIGIEGSSYYFLPVMPETYYMENASDDSPLRDTFCKSHRTWDDNAFQASLAKEIFECFYTNEEKNALASGKIPDRGNRYDDWKTACAILNRPSPKSNAKKPLWYHRHAPVEATIGTITQCGENVLISKEFLHNLLNNFHYNETTLTEAERKVKEDAAELRKTFEDETLDVFLDSDGIFSTCELLLILYLISMGYDAYVEKEFYREDFETTCGYGDQVIRAIRLLEEKGILEYRIEKKKYFVKFVNQYERNGPPYIPDVFALSNPELYFCTRAWEDENSDKLETILQEDQASTTLFDQLKNGLLRWNRPKFITEFQSLSKFLKDEKASIIARNQQKKKEEAMSLHKDELMDIDEKIKELEARKKAQLEGIEKEIRGE